VLSTATMIAALAQAASAKPSVALIAKTAIAATRDTIPASVATLSYGVLRIMFLDKLKTIIPLTLMAAGLLAWLTSTAVPLVSAVPPPNPTIKPQLFVAMHQDSPPSKVDPKPAVKGLNKLLFYKAGHLTIIDPDGVNEKKVIEGEVEFSLGTGRLSPHGKKLAFHVATEGQSLLDPQPSPVELRVPKHKLYVRELSEGKPGKDQDLDIICHQFAWSPDSTTIATTDVVNGPDNRPVTVHYLVDVKTKEKKSLKLPEGHEITDWTRDGKYLLTTSLTPKKTLRINLMNLDGTEHKILTDERESARAGRISPDGTRLLYLSYGPLVKGSSTPDSRDLLHVLDVPTGRKIAVSDLPENGDIIGYCWSPDGKQIAYTWREKIDGEKTAESSLVICELDGKNQKTLVIEKGQAGVITIGQVDWR
jgi:Tol biopolymer transport system component